MSESGRIRDAGPIRKYIMGGNSTFTCVFGEAIGRRTFKVKSSKKNPEANWSTGNQDRDKYWVTLKTGPGDSYTDYMTIGVLRINPLDGYYRFDPKLNADGKMHMGAALFDSIWTPLEQGCTWNWRIEFWHEGSCGVCGRKLTVPESVAAGIGPECAGKGM